MGGEQLQVTSVHVQFRRLGAELERDLFKFSVPVSILVPNDQHQKRFADRLRELAIGQSETKSDSTKGSTDVRACEVAIQLVTTTVALSKVAL